MQQIFAICLNIFCSLVFNTALTIPLKNEVIIEQGVTLYGSQMTTLTGRKFLAFRGIPYTEPPVGNLRFKAPLPKRWNVKEFNATEDGPMCVQFFGKTLMGVEDCLVLNVYTQKISLPLKKVMFFIPGGGFYAGTGMSMQYGPRRLLDRDVVLVAINYRLGPFGFLSTMNEDCPGNFALLDQVEALKWVQRNIAAFGGDPNKVTIFGQSAGSDCVVSHLISPVSKGLFQRAIAQSGNPLCPWGEQKNPLETAKTLAVKVGCLHKSTEETVECLRTTTVEKILNISKFFFNSAGISLYSPVADGYFFSDLPSNLLKEGKIANINVPLLVGSTKDESLTLLSVGIKLGSGWTLSSTSCRMSFPLQFYVLLPNGLSNFSYGYEFVSGLLNIDSKLLNNGIIELIKNRYSLSTNNKTVLLKHLSELFSDSLFTIPTYELIVVLISYGMKPFVYRYDYLSSVGTNVFEGITIKGVGHGSDLQFLFDQPGNFSNVPNDKTENTFLDIWTNFAEYGYPVLETNSERCELKPATESAKILVHFLNKRISALNYQPKKDWKFKFWVDTVPDAIYSNSSI